MANKNTNPVGGKTAVPADINNAQPAYFPKPHHTWEGLRPRCPPPTRNRTNAKIKLFSKIAQYRNQISTLLRGLSSEVPISVRPADILCRGPDLFSGYPLVKPACQGQLRRLSDLHPAEDGIYPTSKAA